MDELDDSDCEIVGDGKPFIGEQSQAPKFLNENDDLVRGYRINYKTPMLATKSLCCLHNEWVNIWSHLLATMLFFFIGIYFIVQLAPPQINATSILN